MKRLQNRIAESGFLLPVMSVVGLAVWILAGLVANNWWPQIVCFVLSVYLMVEMSNGNALLRVRSRMVSATFIALSCTTSFMFASLSGALVQLFAITALLLMFTTYQAPMALGRTFYAFVMIGLASTLFPHILFFVPLLWLLMATQLQSLSWRSLMASVIGLIAPYWFYSLWFIYQRDFTPLADHFCSLADFTPLFHAYATLGLAHWLAYALTVVLTVAGTIEFWRDSIEDKIRIRLLYNLFGWLSLAILLFVALQPQHYDPLMRLAAVTCSPIIAHMLTLTSSKLSNIMFFVVIAAAVAVTAISLFVH